MINIHDYVAGPDPRPPCRVCNIPNPHHVLMMIPVYRDEADVINLCTQCLIKLAHVIITRLGDQ